MAACRDNIVHAVAARSVAGEQSTRQPDFACPGPPLISHTGSSMPGAGDCESPPAPSARSLESSARPFESAVGVYAAEKARPGGIGADPELLRSLYSANKASSVYIAQNVGLLSSTACGARKTRSGCASGRLTASLGLPLHRHRLVIVLEYFDELRVLDDERDRRRSVRERTQLDDGVGAVL